MFDDLDDIKIALVAPSRAGKSTLICAMKSELQRRLSTFFDTDRKRAGGSTADVVDEAKVKDIKFHPINTDKVFDFYTKVTGKNPEAPNVSTAEHLEPREYEYNNQLKHLCGINFEANTKGDADSPLLSFDIRSEVLIADRPGGRIVTEGMPFEILDYPGGAVSRDMPGCPDLHADTLESYVEDCFALVVPVFSLALVNRKKNFALFEQHMRSQGEYEKIDRALFGMLRQGDVVEHIRRWCQMRAIEKRHGILIFAPVKCETFFTDAAHGREDLVTLAEQTKEVYFDALCASLKHFNSDIFADVKQLVSVMYSPVMTFGRNTLGQGDFHLVKQPKEVFQDRYRKCWFGAAPDPLPSGAAWIIHHIIKRRYELMDASLRGQGEGLQDVLNNQGAFERFIKELFPINSQKRAQIKELDVKRKIHKAFYKAIESMDMSGDLGIKEQSCAWRWDACLDSDRNVGDYIDCPQCGKQFRWGVQSSCWNCDWRPDFN